MRCMQFRKNLHKLTLMQFKYRTHRLHCRGFCPTHLVLQSHGICCIRIRICIRVLYGSRSEALSVIPKGADPDLCPVFLSVGFGSVFLWIESGSVFLLIESGSGSKIFVHFSPQNCLIERKKIIKILLYVQKVVTHFI